jgi:hypothetical protein
MIQDTVHLETVVFTCMIDRTIKQDGNRKKIFKEPKNRDGEELITLT